MADCELLENCIISYSIYVTLGLKNFPVILAIFLIKSVLSKIGYTVVSTGNNSTQFRKI